jgi:hypothetical protein
MIGTSYVHDIGRFYSGFSDNFNSPGLQHPANEAEDEAQTQLLARRGRLH